MKARRDYRILSVLSLPPPTAGQTLAGAMLIRCFENAGLDHREFNLSKSFTASDSRRKLARLVALGMLPAKILKERQAAPAAKTILYLHLGHGVGTMLRDAPIIATALGLRMPVVVHVHGGAFRASYERAPWFLQASLATLLGRVSRAIVLSESLKSMFYGLVPPERITAVANGVDEETERAAEDAAARRKSIGKRVKRDLKVLFLSNMLEKKGYRTVLDAAAAAQARGLAHEFVLAGSITSETRVDPEEFIRRNELRNTKFYGSVEGARKHDILAESDVFVLPSANEGQPICILEAMHFGLPIITTAVGGIPDIVSEGKTCLFMPIDDPIALLEAIERLACDDSLRTSIGDANRTAAREQYTETAHCDAMMRVFDEIARETWPELGMVGALSSRRDEVAGKKEASLLLPAPEKVALDDSRRNRVAPIVAHAVLDGFADGGADLAEWRLEHDKSAARMAIMMRCLDEIGRTLAVKGIRVVALKNAGIARGIYPCAACCPMGDMDLLVSRGRFLDAHELLLGLGYDHASRAKIEGANLEENLLSGGAEYRRAVDGEEVWVELQWRPIAGRWIRKDQEPDGERLLERSVAIEGTDVRLLHPTDNMIQVCLHTAKHSYVRAPGIRLHTDVERLVRYAPPDWEEVLAAARALSVKTPVYFSLLFAKNLLGTPIPRTVLAALRPPRWKEEIVVRWAERAGFFDPDEKKFSRPGMLLFHALLYDDAKGLAASALDTEPGRLRLANAPGLTLSAVKRMFDLVTRYQA